MKSIVIGLYKDGICPSWSDEIIRTVEIGKQIYFQSIETLDADTNPDIMLVFLLIKILTFFRGVFMI